MDVLRHPETETGPESRIWTSATVLFLHVFNIYSGLKILFSRIQLVYIVTIIEEKPPYVEAHTGLYFHDPSSTDHSQVHRAQFIRGVLMVHLMISWPGSPGAPGAHLDTGWTGKNASSFMIGFPVRCCDSHGQSQSRSCDISESWLCVNFGILFWPKEGCELCLSSLTLQKH